MTGLGGRATRRSAWIVLAAAILVGSAVGLTVVDTARPVAAASGPEVSTAAVGQAQPALDVDFPDPTVLVDGGTYYAYSTEVAFYQIQVTSSVDLTNWTPVADALPTLPSWANYFHTWAPSVIRIGSTYVMYYTVQQASSGQQCISRATATSPLGPFTDTSTAPFVCQNGLGGSIDPAAFLDSGGNLYLFWKSDGNSLGLPTDIWGQQLSGDGSALLGSAVQLLQDGPAWEAGIIEGPGMVAANGIYYLFHSGNAWQTASSAIGYASCTSPLGPCTEVTTAAPWLGSQGLAAGPGSPEFFVGTDGLLRMAYHAWNPSRIGYAAGGVRSLWVDQISFGSQGPVATSDGVSGSSTSHLRVAGPQSATPGVPFALTVTALDPSGATDPTYQGTVHFTSSDLAAVLPPDYTFTAADAGVHSFDGVELQTPGAQTVTVSDTSTAAIFGSVQIAVAGTPVAAGGTVWSASGD
ncbi:MAG TPA: glycoside hydrolase family 43 protein, partial [Acidimicrobiales bacterium]|nr:glycoside hydrolase family 43 protein [Acidimicrobiales bacterium]